MNKRSTRFARMAFRGNVCLRGAALTSLLLLSAPLIMSQNSQQPASKKTASAASSGQTSPEAISAAMWQKISVVCPVPGAGSATFIAFPEDHKRFYPIGGTVLEYRGAWTRLVPGALTEADRLDGVEFKALAIMGGVSQRSSRFRKETTSSIAWSKWTDVSHEPVPKVYGENISYDFLALTIVELKKRANRWVYKSPEAESPFDPDDFAPGRRSCAALTAVNREP